MRKFFTLLLFVYGVLSVTLGATTADKVQLRVSLMCGGGTVVDLDVNKDTKVEELKKMLSEKGYNCDRIGTFDRGCMISYSNEFTVAQIISRRIPIKGKYTLVGTTDGNPSGSFGPPPPVDPQTPSGGKKCCGCC